MQLIEVRDFKTNDCCQFALFTRILNHGDCKSVRCCRERLILYLASQLDLVGAGRISCINCRNREAQDSSSRVHAVTEAVCEVP